MKTYSTALITGASSGIGAAYARQLAAAGTSLMLVARRAEPLEQLAAELRQAHGVSVDVFAADLGAPAPGARVAAEAARRGLTVDLLINNAGFGESGYFHKYPQERHQAMIALNVGAVVDLVHAFLPGMLERKHGAIVNVASLAGFQPTPYFTVYGATKAFVLSFSEGLWAEYHRRGVHTLAVCPGLVDTPFFEATGDEALRRSLPKALMMTPEQVAAQSLKALAAGRSAFVPGLHNRVAAFLPRLLPRKAVAAAAARMVKR